MKRTRRVSFALPFFFACLMALAGPSAAQQSVMEQQFGVIPTPSDRSLRFTNGSVVVAPIPFRDPVVGSGLALGGGIFIKTIKKPTRHFWALAVSKQTMEVLVTA